MNKSKIINIAAVASVVIALVAYAAYVLVGICPDVLITAQDRNVFTSDSMFFSESISRPFGFVQYIGAFLTQFFYYPALGACMLIAIWLVSAFAGIKAFGLKGLWKSLMIVPIACLLSSEVDLGYWVYCLTLPGYWFAQSVAFLIAMLLLWAANSTPRRFRIGWYAVVGFVLFPVLGWVSYLFTICLALSQFMRSDDKKATATWIDGVGITLSAVAPLIFGSLLYGDIAVNDVYLAGFPLFRNASDSTIRCAIPFFILSGSMVVISLGRVLPAVKKVPSWASCLVVGVASAVVVWTTIFKDDNYIYEMQMTQATLVDDWQGVISVAEKAEKPTRAMVILKNIALLNTGELSRSFELSNDGVDIYNPDSLNLSLMHIVSPLIYYNHGLVNFANRWCMEFAIPFGFSPYYLKILARSAQTNGENLLAQKYIGRLHNTQFYKDWQPAPATPVVKELKNVLPDTLDNDENNCDRYIISSFSQKHYPNCPNASELTLVYSMIVRNAQNFWISLLDYMKLRQVKDLPTQYQEGYVLFMDQAPVAFPIKVDVSPIVEQNYKRFWDTGNGYAQNMDEDGTREAMRSEWAATYWWFNAFGRSKY